MIDKYNLIDNQIKKSIYDELHRIAADNQIRILYACESGSRGWGLASQDSDYDVRFIFVHPTEWYLSVLPQDDGLDLFSDRSLDICGWDIRKVLRLLMHSNATIYEWIQSPIVYLTDADFHASLWSLSQHFFQPQLCLQHYAGLAMNLHRKHLQSQSEIPTHRLLHFLRPLLAALWIVETQRIPPMNVKELIQLNNNGHLITDLFDNIHENNNLEAMIHLDIHWQEFIQSSIEKCNLQAHKMELLPMKPDMLDAFFRMVIKTYNGDY